MDRDLIPCEILSPTFEHLRFAASAVLGTDERFFGSHDRRQGQIVLEAFGDSVLPRNLFLSHQRYELNQQHAVKSAVLRFVEPSAFIEACIAVISDLQASDDAVAVHEVPAMPALYRITMPVGSLQTNSEGVALAAQHALSLVGARPRLSVHLSAVPESIDDAPTGKYRLGHA